MLDLVYFLNLNVFYDFLLTSLSGFLIWLSMYFFRQYWIENIFIILVYVLLPTSIFVITKVISNNIALALGMVGALSIVRFRNPVKNPFELVMYFVLITLGITYSVNRPYGIIFTIFVLAVLIFFMLLKNKFKNLFGIKNSFSNLGLYSIVVESKNKIIFDNFEQNIIEKNFFINDDEYQYRLTSNEKKTIIEIENFLNENKQKYQIKSYQINLNEN